MAEITNLPNTGFAPTNKAIADHLVELAESIAQPDSMPVKNVVVLIEYADGELQRQCCGQPIDMARIVGLLTIAAARAATETDE